LPLSFDKFYTKLILKYLLHFNATCMQPPTMIFILQDSVTEIFVGNHHSSVGLALGYWLDDRSSWFRLPARELGIFLFTTASRTALGPTCPPIQWVPGSLSLGLKQPGPGTDHLPPSSAKVKEYVKLYFCSPNTPSWHGAQFQKKHRNNFIFTFTEIFATFTWAERLIFRV
jgi:hypothetical protein